MAGRTLRTFVAFAVGRETRERLAREARRLSACDRRLRAVRAENLHLTVAFLGPTPDDAVAAIGDALVDLARGVQPLEVRCEGLGAFPRPSAARVVFAGLVETRGGNVLPGVARAVGERLQALGFASDVEHFHPHVTLGRLEGGRPSAALEKSLTEGHLQDTYSPEVLSTLRLMVSEPGPGGAGVRYRSLVEAPLIGKAPLLGPALPESPSSP